MQEPHTVAIENGLFTWIGADASFSENDSDIIIDGKNKYLFPGLIDCHVHLVASHDEILAPYSTIFRTKDGEKIITGLKNAQKYLVSGFTTIRDCGAGLEYSTPAIRDSIASKTFIGPRLLVAEHTISQPGNQEQFGPQYFLDFDNNTHNEGSGSNNVIQAVRERKRRGADFIKTMTTGGVVHGKGSKVQLYFWRTEELEAMVSEAERLGMYVAVHAHNSDGILKAVQCGARTIEHGTFLTEEIVDCMVQKGTFLVPTESAGLFILNASDEIKKKLHPEVVEKWQTVSNEMVKSHKLAYKKGVNIAFGTDLPVSSDHGASALELQYLHENLDMPPEEVFYCATLQSARALKLDDKIGSIEVGKIGDCVLFEENPLIDVKIVQNRKKILMVIKEGVVVAEKGVLASFDLFS